LNYPLYTNYPIAPTLVIPGTLQAVFLWITIVLAAGVLVAALIVSVKHRSAVPLLMVIGGFAAILLEPVVTFLGHAVHPKSGQIMLFETVGRAIPWHIALGYMGGFGIFYLLTYTKYVAGGLTSQSIWKISLVTALCYYAGEAYPVEHSLWAYYGYQPLWIWKGTAPPTWSVLNATCMLTSATLMLLSAPYLRGVAQLLLVPLAISGAFMGHMGAGFLMYNAMNADVPHWVIELSGVLTVGMALILVWICTLLLTRGLPRLAASVRG
jgi:hypothetical protein